MKISIIGSGNIGSNAAYSLLLSNTKIAEIVLLDVNSTLAEGNALDLSHAASVFGKSIKFTGTSNYSHSEGSDFIIITAGKPRTAEMKTRLELLEPNFKIAVQIAKELKPYTGQATVVIVSNPMDVMTYCFYKLLDLPKDKIIGMGGSLDTARLHSIGLNGIVYGEHGDEMIFSENISKEEKAVVKQFGSRVLSMKGHSGFATGAAIASLIEKLHNSGSEVISYVFDGELGIKGAIGVPAQLKSHRVLKLEKIPEEKLSELRTSSANLSQMIEFVDSSIRRLAPRN